MSDGAVRTVADDLWFPEGPVVMDDGSVIVCEIRAARLTKIAPDGTRTTVAEWGDPLGAGPNGAAIGPDGQIWICNNGGFWWHEVDDGVWIPQDPATGAIQPPNYTTGSIDRVDPATGTITTVYTQCDGVDLRGPNDLVFDATGGFWFTDMGKTRPGVQDYGAVYYTRPDGSSITRMPGNFNMANGIGLSPDGSVLYVSETVGGHVWAIRLAGPGVVSDDNDVRFIEHHPGTCLVNSLGYFDSLAVQADGRPVVAALGEGLCVVEPDGSGHHFVEVDDPMVTNVAFGGSDMATAFVTLSGSGRLVAVDWGTPGLALAFSA
jgi:gluconolactonase